MCANNNFKTKTFQTIILAMQVYLFTIVTQGLLHNSECFAETRNLMEIKIESIKNKL